MKPLKNNLKTALWLLLISMPFFSGYAQDNALIGREFYVAGWQNLSTSTIEQLTILVFAYGTGTVTIAGTDHSVTAGGQLTVNLPLSTYTGTKSLKITSDVDIVVYAGELGNAPASADATAVLPVTSLGTEYRLFQYPPDNFQYQMIWPYQYRVIATEANTLVYQDGTLKATLLNTGDVYVNSQTTVDLTGAKVTADKPVAVFSGTAGSKRLSSAEDVLIEQMWPVPTWGKEYILVRLGSSQNNCRVISNESTTVSVNVKRGTLPDTTLLVPPNGFREFQFNELTRITSDMPIAVAQYTTGDDNPSMMWVNPIAQRVENAKLARLTNWTTWVTVLTREQDFDLTSFKVNGVVKAFTNTQTSTGIPGWKAGRYLMSGTENLAEVSNPNGLVAMIEGYATYKSYIYAAAGGSLDLRSYFTVETKTLPLNDTHYSATTSEMHTFEEADSLVLKRTVEKSFTALRWLVNGTVVTGQAANGIHENLYTINTVKIPASLLNQGENTVSMSVRYSGATADSVYTGNVWRAAPPLPPAKVQFDVAGSYSCSTGPVPGLSMTRSVRFSSGTGPLPQDVTVNITYSGDTDNYSGLPSSVTIPAGSTSQSFTLTLKALPASLSVLTMTIGDISLSNVTPDVLQNTCTIYAYPVVTPGKIASSQSICTGQTPAPLTSLSPASCDGATVHYQWQSRRNNAGGTGYTAWVDITPNGTSEAYTPPGPLTQTTYFRRSAAASPTVNSTTLGCMVYSDTVTVTVDPLPVLIQRSDTTFEDGEAVAVIPFEGTGVGAATSWTNSNTAIGLAASGTGTSLPAFTATNTGSLPITVTITVTPKSAAGCAGVAQTFTITVNPKAALLRRDTATVQEYFAVKIPVLDNDDLPADVLTPTFSLNERVVPGSGPRAGYLTAVGSGANAHFVYRHTGYDPVTSAPVSLANGIDSFTYQAGGMTAKAYIYILQSASGTFAACQSSSHTTTLKTVPTGGVAFYWYDSSGNMPLAGNPAASHTGPVPATYYVEPHVTAGAYAGLVFPKGELKLSGEGSSSTPVAMRWTGQVNTDWNNPNNWVAMKTDGGKAYEAPADFAPTKCVNVIIPSTVDYFPELVDSAWCADILMKDRSMLKNPHVLNYAKASVELKLKPAERDRFVMWSAPLMNMYSGDYHYRVNNAPYWGDTYMNYFQHANPDPQVSGQATANHFTATTGSVNQELDLGTAFNLKVTTTTVTRDSFLRFPRAEAAYNYNSTQTPALDRSLSGKFITHGRTLTGGVFNLPVSGTALTGVSLVQVVNPYLAYLDFSKFSAANNNLSGYYTWSGDPGDGFATVIIMNNGNRIVTSAPAWSSDPTLIAPLQSFFVAATSAIKTDGSVQMSPNWTTTSPVSSYSLRASRMVSSGGVLHITLSQGERKACAALLYDPGASNFMDPEDMPAIIYKDLPLAVYTFSMNEALAINSSSTFDMFQVPLGFRATTAGETRLEFNNQETFGYDVVLIDKALNKRTDLSVTPEYTFTVTKTGAAAVEINDRFSLEMRYTGNGVTITGNEAAAPSPALQVSAGAGYIHIKSEAGVIGSLHVYDALGRLIFGTPNLNESRFKLPVSGKQLYIVKASAGGATFVEKIMPK